MNGASAPCVFRANLLTGPELLIPKANLLVPRIDEDGEPLPDFDVAPLIEKTNAIREAFARLIELPPTLPLEVRVSRRDRNRREISVGSDNLVNP